MFVYFTALKDLKKVKHIKHLKQENAGTGHISHLHEKTIQHFISGDVMSPSS